MQYDGQRYQMEGDREIRWWESHAARQSEQYLEVRGGDRGGGRDKREEEEEEVGAPPTERQLIRHADGSSH